MVRILLIQPRITCPKIDIFLISQRKQNIQGEVLLMSTHNICFLQENKKKKKVSHNLNTLLSLSYVVLVSGQVLKLKFLVLREKDK